MTEQARPRPEKHMQTKCGFMVTGGLMSYQCELPLGHFDEKELDTEPHYSTEVAASVRRWEAWYFRKQERAQMPPLAQHATDPGPEQIVCPTCKEGVMTIEDGKGSCDTCGLVAYDARADAPEVAPTKVRPGDQPLPGDGQDCVQDAIIAAMVESKRVGIERYASVLKTFNGRKGFQDVIEEARDFFVYGTQILMEAEASREQLIDVVRASFDAYDDQFTGGSGDGSALDNLGYDEVAILAVDAIMGWVTGQLMDKPRGDDD